MEKIKASLIISVYKNVPFLKAVLDALQFQTEKRFEVIISEDGEDAAMRRFVNTYNFSGSLLHMTQPDLGWQKNRALNRAAESAQSDYLVFIDGDCLPHPRFMEFHIGLAQEPFVLAGKRIKLDAFSSELLLNGQLTITLFQKYLFRNYLAMKRRGAAFMEEGFFIDPQSLLGFVPRLRSMYQLKGCNMSFSKQAFYAINGFDEDYVRPAIGEDIDLVWRFEGLGYELKSVRNLAVQYHLYHTENWTNQEENVLLMQQKQDKLQFFCSNGTTKRRQ